MKIQYIYKYIYIKIDKKNYIFFFQKADLDKKKKF